MTLTEMDDGAFVKALSAFDEDRVLFGSDSPWTEQKEMVDRTLRLGLPERKLEKLMALNACGLLGITAS
jgi:predicted TIM-barrel fold metal-dependent hydrolase